MERRLDARLRDLPSPAFHELVGRISSVDEFKGWWKGRSHAYPSVLKRLRKQTIKVSADSSARTAARNPFPPSRNPPWGKRRTGEGSGEGAQRAGYAELLRSVVSGFRDMEFGQDLILRFHADLFRYPSAHRAHRGRYKKIPDKPPAYIFGELGSLALRPTEPHLIAREMEILTGWAADRLTSPGFHPLLVIPAFLLEFLAIRPFADGNGRMSRILATLLLLQCGYEHVSYLSLEKIIEERRMEYAIALRRAQAKRNVLRPDITAWLRVFLEGLQAQAAELGTLLEGRTREDRLSGNQRAVLSLLDRHGEVTIRLACRELGIPRDTAKQVLGRLYDRNLLLRSGAGRATRYLRVPLSAG